MYTQLNQYHVILEAQPQFQLDPDKLNHIFIQANAASGTTWGRRVDLFRSQRLNVSGLECAHRFGALHAKHRPPHSRHRHPRA